MLKRSFCEQLKCYIKGLEFSIQLLDSVRKHYEKKLMDEDKQGLITH